MRTAKDSLAHFIYLATRDPDSTVPEKSVTDNWDRGCNIQIWGATDEVLERFHKNN